MKNHYETIQPIVNWCLDQSEKLNEGDSLALLREFDEWVQFEAEEIDNLEVFTVDNNQPK